MIDLSIKAPHDCQIKKKIAPYENDQKLSIDFVFNKKMTVEKDTLFVGFVTSAHNKARTFLMTHEDSVERYQIPFAFPAFMGVFGDENMNGAWMTLDYYNLHFHFRTYKKESKSKLISFGLTNESFEVDAHQVINISVIYHVYQNKAPRLTSMIKLCANHILKQSKIKPKQELSLTTNIHNYSDAVHGLSNNLTDDRARIQDGTGTFIPYGYLEKNPYSESFALMDVAKGMLPYALWNNKKHLIQLMYDELLKITDENLDYPWIEHDHHTDGFFHLAWGSLPVGVTKEYIKKQSIGLFSDVDGHEEGPNLLSTWKYFYRVEILGEMALLTREEKIIKGFLKTLPFISKLKMEHYAQPVTYDLDTHLPATGKKEGGSAGGAAFWSIIHFTAYDLTKNEIYLQEALNGMKHANSLDFNQFYSMRVAPKPTTVGWLTKANVYAYELTKNIKYIEYARETAHSIYFFYYISPHPYTYFSTLGFGYACSRERWEAFLEMVESLYGISFFLKYNDDRNLLKLFWFARENWLWALPLNGNPYGNLGRPYDSIGGEYIPYEFSTGSLGDNTGIEGGSQSSMRQIKEIYGSGEVYLAYMMFEMNAHITDRKFLIVKSDLVNDLLNPTLQFIIYNTQEEKGTCIVTFTHLKSNAYVLYRDSVSLGVYQSSYLNMGIPFELLGEQYINVVLKPYNTIPVDFEYQVFDFNMEYTGFENVKLTWEEIHRDQHTHYRVIVKNQLNIRNYDVQDTFISVTLDRELEHQIEIISVSPQQLYMSKPYNIPALKHSFSFRLRGVNQNVLTYNHADLIYDEHMWMFYGQKDKHQMDVLINVQRTFSKEDVIQFEVSSINEDCTYELVVNHPNNRKTKIHSSSNAQLIEHRIADLEDENIESMYFIVQGMKGLGFSMKRFDICSFSELSQINLYQLKDQKPFVHNHVFRIQKELRDLLDYEYIDIHVEGLTKGSDLKVLLDENEIEMEIEQKFPEKKYRNMNGVYRFRSNRKEHVLLAVESHSSKMRVHEIRLTNNQNYPKYAESIRYKEDDYEEN